MCRLASCRAFLVVEEYRKKQVVLISKRSQFGNDVCLFYNGMWCAGFKCNTWIGLCLHQMPQLIPNGNTMQTTKTGYLVASRRGFSILPTGFTKFVMFGSFDSLKIWDTYKS